ncbi:MAG: hypothetical protein WC575_04405 [Patescibacteria group bacterium]
MKKFGGLIIIFTACICWFIGCSIEGDMDDMSKYMIFTDHRGFDEKIIIEDIKRLSQGIDANPKDAKMLLARGFVWASIHRYGKAIDDFKKAESLGDVPDAFILNTPVKKQACFLTSLAYWQDGDRKNALIRLTNVINQNPKHARSYFYRGIINLQEGNRTIAGRDLVDAIEFGDSHEKQFYSHVLAEIQDMNNTNESTHSSFITSFLSNQPPQSRPFGYVWQIVHELK